MIYTCGCSFTTSEYHEMDAHKKKCGKPVNDSVMDTLLHAKRKGPDTYLQQKETVEIAKKQAFENKWGKWLE